VRVLLLALGIVVADQTTKLLVKGVSIPSLGIQWQGMALGTSRPLLGDLLRLTYIENPGMAFGIDVGGKLFFSLFSLLASIGILYYLFRSRTERLGFRVALAMVLGGAAGNLIDRMFYGVVFREAPFFYGRVVDFIDVDILDVNLFGYHLSRWPVFNIADASVTVGVLLLILYHRTLQPSPDRAVSPADVLGTALDAGGTPQRSSVPAGSSSAAATDGIR
jgi:signal peptidase II